MISIFDFIDIQDVMVVKYDSSINLFMLELTCFLSLQRSESYRIHQHTSSSLERHGQTGGF